MTTELRYAAFVSQYNYALRGPLNVRDTESLFNLDGPVPPAPAPPGTMPPFFVNTTLYTLPGRPFDSGTTPNERTLRCNLASFGSPPAGIAPLDWALVPVPSLADFRVIFLFGVGDFARVRWNGLMWVLSDLGGPTAVVKGVDQTVTVYQGIPQP